MRLPWQKKTDAVPPIVRDPIVVSRLEDVADRLEEVARSLQTKVTELRAEEAERREGIEKGGTNG